MSGVAGNKVSIAKRLGRGTLPGWLAREDGSPIMDDEVIPEPHLHLPLGGTREIGSHKGYGLAVMLEVLTTVLAGAGAGPDRRAGQAHHFLAYRIDAFTDLEQFKDDMDTYLRRLREAKTAPGEERVYYAGLHASETEQNRRANGIPYHREVVEWFKTMVAALGVEDRLPAVG
jgi:LDH2 family malate/lactate/ureidoglycolate dehydrogenase